jgi:hypothetical protein
VARVFYRLVPEPETVLAKTHMPYLLSPARMAKFRGWFLDADYRVDALPSYELEQASNPFISFAAIPPDSRYRFLLDEAEFFIMNFIKGPVCRGQVALDVIEDRFWVYFIDPKRGAPSCWRARPTTFDCLRPTAATPAYCSAAGASWPSASAACSPPRRRK